MRKGSEKIKVNAVSLTSGNADDPEADEINALVAKRTEAKKNKDFAAADKIREELNARGIIVTDTPQGVVWKRK